jgi:hypothetical protein
MQLIECPSGLKFNAERKWVLGDRRILMDRATIKSGRLLHRMLDAVVGSIEDPGPYAFSEGRVDWGQVSNADIVSGVVKIRCMTRSVFEFNSLCEFCSSTMPLQADLQGLDYKKASADGVAHLRTGEPVSRVYQALDAPEKEGGNPIGPAIRLKLKLLRGEDHITLMQFQKEESDAGMVELQNCMQILEMQVGEGEVWTWEDDADKIRGFYGRSEWDFDEALEAVIFELGGGVKTELPVICRDCKGEQTQLLPFNQDFFIPRKKRRAFSMTAG